MVRRQGDWLSARVGDELVMMSAEKGNYIGLSEVGARIWDIIETPSEVAAVWGSVKGAPGIARRRTPTTLDGSALGLFATVQSPPAKSSFTGCAAITTKIELCG